MRKASGLTKIQSKKSGETPGFALLASELFSSGIWSKLENRHRAILPCVLSHYPNMWPSIARLEELSGYKRRAVIRALNELDHIGLLIKKKRLGSNGYCTTNEYQLADLQNTSVVEGILKYLNHPQFIVVMSNLYGGCKSDSVGAEVYQLLSHRKVVSDTVHQGGVRSGALEVVSDRVHTKKTSIKKQKEEHAAFNFVSHANCPSDNNEHQLRLSDSIHTDYNNSDSLDSDIQNISIDPQLLKKVSVLANTQTEYHIDPVDGTRYQTLSTISTETPPPSPNSPRGHDKSDCENRAMVCRTNNIRRSNHPTFHVYESILSNDAEMGGENLMLATNLVCEIGYSEGELRNLVKDTKRKAESCHQGLLLKRLQDGDRIDMIEGYDETNPTHKDARDRAVYWLEDHGIVSGGQRMILKEHLMILVRLQSYGNQANSCLDDFCRDYKLAGDAPAAVIVAKMKQHLKDHLQELLRSAVHLASNKELAGCTVVKNQDSDTIPADLK